MIRSVLPRPKKVYERKGKFRFGAEVPILLSWRSDDAERFAGTMLADVVADFGGVPPAVERCGKLEGLAAPTVQMFLFGRDEKLCPDLAQLKPKEDIGREGYVIEITPQRVLVGANTSAGLFYAAVTLRHLLRTERSGAALPCCRIVDWPDFKYRGFMLDVSRFRVPKQETLIRLILRLAACKINVLQLYVEHTFRCRRHPGYSEGVSPLTAEQLSELDELCAMLHIELQANQQSLGHQQYMLSQPGFEHLSEQRPEDPPIVRADGRKMPKPWSFALSEPKVYELLDDIYAEHLTAVRSGLVNLGCDEVYDLGAGRSKKLVARKGKLSAFVDHVVKISKLAAKYGKQTMIWDDMIRNHPEVLEMLPEDIIPVFWWYSDKPNPAYAKIWANSGRRHWVAPGCGSWQSITSRIERAWKNIHWMTSAGKRGGAEGVLNTEWGDYGNFQTLAVSYMSIAIGAELSWNSKPMDSTAEFDRRFARCVFNDPTGRMGKLYRLLGRTNHVFKKMPYQGPPWLLYWDKFPDGEHLVEYNDPAALDRCEQLASEALELAKELRRDPPFGVEDSLFEELISAADQTLFACRKTRLAARVREALADGGKLSAELKREVRNLAKEWDRQREQFKRVWLLTSERSQIDYRLRLYTQRKADYSKLLGSKKRRPRSNVR